MNFTKCNIKNLNNKYDITHFKSDLNLYYLFFFNKYNWLTSYIKQREYKTKLKFYKTPFEIII